VDLDIKVNRMRRIEDDEKSIKAYADIEVGGALELKGIRVVKGKNGIFVGMPREKGKDNKWYETIRVVTQEAKDRISSIVLSAYKGDEQ
jgi:stage V sporulation protein G